jgi:predicted nucleic acid-binding protein
VDAGPLYAYVDADDANHAACLDILESYPGPLIVPQLVITEAAYFIGRRLGPEPELRFVSDLASGVFHAEPVQPADWFRIGQLVWRYRDLRLGTVDSSVIAAAERLGLTAVVTLDRPHFSVVKPNHTAAFTLLP